MTETVSPYVEMSNLLPRLRRRLPGVAGKWKGWLRLQDWLYARGTLDPENHARLRSRMSDCESPVDWFDFAAACFPAHQRRQEILEFLELASRHSPKVVVEIGTAQGGTQFLLGQVLTSVELILAVDLHVWNRRLLDAFSRSGLDRVCLEGSSYDQSTIEAVMRTLGGRKIDLLFIDGDHRYEGVRADYLAYAPFVAEGGLIAFHDIVPDHRTRFGTKGAGWAGDVPRYWQEVRVGRSFQEFIADPDQDGLGIGVIQL